MKFFFLLLFSLLIVVTNINAQGDDCFNAVDLGTLPTPEDCAFWPSPTAGFGLTITENGTTTGFTPGNPYVYMTDCGSGTVDMSTGSNDVWYSFESTGTVLEVSLTGAMPNTNLGLWTGNCLNLSGIGCVIGDASGNIPTTLFEALAPGQTYFIQISGNSTTSNGNFTLNLNNNIDCNDCYQGGSLVANPPPINGVYSAGQDVEFCFTLTDYSQVNSNWLHAIQVEWSAGWETTTTNVVTNPPPSGSGAGVWTWYPNGIGMVNGVNWPSGFYFDHFSIPGWGESQAENYDLEFCWTLTTLDPINCSSSIPLSVTVNTSADGESGSWTSFGCANDPAITFEGVLSCCAVAPDMSASDLTCLGGPPDGTATVVSQGTISPWTYQWYDENGVLITTVTNSTSNTNTLTGLAAGNYTVVVTDFSGCTSGNSVTVNDFVSTPPNMSSTDADCGGGTNGTATAIAQGTNGPWMFLWFDSLGTLISQTINSTSNTDVISNLPIGDYSVIVTDFSGCSFSNTVTVQEPTAGAPIFEPISICVGEPLNMPTTSINGITGSWSPAPDNTATATYTFTPDPGQCASSTSMNVHVEPGPSATITGGTFICAGATIDLTAVLGGIAPMVTWSSAEGTFSSNTALTTTFSPTISAGIAFVTATVFSPICMNTVQETIQLVVATSVTPTFTQIPPICAGQPLNLPLGSTNGVVGTWSPAPDNTTTTTYTFTPDPGQCGTVVTMTVDVIQSYSTTDVQSSCDSYTWIDGNTYTASNNSATYTYTTSLGCDSLVTLDLTINNSVTGTDTQVSCDSYTWIDGNTYNSSNNSATWLLSTSSGCDSTVTLDLTINNSVTGTDTQVSCDSYTWIDGNTYNSSNNSAT